MPHSGSCLCGQTKIEIVGESSQDQILCHCTDCRQTSGSALNSNILALKKNVTITGPTKEFTTKAASQASLKAYHPTRLLLLDWFIVTRVFCDNCGSAISHLSPLFGESQAIQIGSFADFARIPIKTELFVKDRWIGLAPIEGVAQVQAMP